MCGVPEGVRFSSIRGDRWAIYDALEDICRQAPPTAYLEIGVSHGDSLRVVLNQCEPKYITLNDEWGSDSGGQSLGGHGHITALLSELKYGGRATYLDGSSHDQLPRHFFTRFYDLITVDGDHSENGAWLDLLDAWPLLAPGGYIVFDDVAPDFFHPYLLELWERFCHDTGCKEVHRALVDKFGEHTLSHGVVVGRKI
jgi:hypothetical protein